VNFWLRRLLVYALVGPVVGGLVTVILLWGGRVLSLRDDVLPMMPVALFLSYVLGTLPALATGVLDGLLARRGWPARGRMAWCALFGAGVSIPAAIVLQGPALNPLTMAVALAGALASLACGAVAARLFRPAARQP